MRRAVGSRDVQVDADRCDPRGLDDVLDVLPSCAEWDIAKPQDVGLHRCIWGFFRVTDGTHVRHDERRVLVVVLLMMVVVVVMRLRLEGYQRVLLCSNTRVACVRDRRVHGVDVVIVRQVRDVCVHGVRGRRGSLRG